MKCIFEAVFRSVLAVAAVTSVFSQSLFVFGWMGHLCNAIRLPGRQKEVVVIFLEVGWYCQATC